MTAIALHSIGRRQQVIETMAALCAVVFFLSPETIAQTDRTSDSSATFTIRIEQREIASDRSVDTIAVWLEPTANKLAGFSLKLAVKDFQLRITEIIPGELIDSCGWELFSPRRIDNSENLLEPSQVWKVVGLAKASADTARPRCNSFNRKVSLLRVVIDYQRTPGSDSSLVPIFFYWQSCADNSLTDMSGASLSLSKAVFNPGGSRVKAKLVGFPTRAGTPDSCIKTELANHPRRTIEFRNGGVRPSMSTFK